MVPRPPRNRECPSFASPRRPEFSVAGPHRQSPPANAARPAPLDSSRGRRRLPTPEVFVTRNERSMTTSSETGLASSSSILCGSPGTVCTAAIGERSLNEGRSRSRGSVSKCICCTRPLSTRYLNFASRTVVPGRTLTQINSSTSRFAAALPFRRRWATAPTADRWILGRPTARPDLCGPVRGRGPSAVRQPGHRLETTAPRSRWPNEEWPVRNRRY